MFRLQENHTVYFAKKYIIFSAERRYNFWENITNRFWAGRILVTEAYDGILQRTRLRRNHLLANSR